MRLPAKETGNPQNAIKVLHLIDSGGLYGAEKMLLTLVEEQLRQGLEPMILSAGEYGIEDKAVEVEAKRLGLPIKQWRMAPGLNLREAWAILKWANLLDFNVFHSHGYKFNILFSFFPKYLTRIPMVTTLHGYVNAKKYSKMWMYEILDRFSLKRVRHICLVSHHMDKLPFLKNIDSDRISVIPNGISLNLKSDSLELDEEIKNFINCNDINILVVGRLSAEKNITSILKVMTETQIRKKSIGVSIIGEGSLSEALMQERDSLELYESVRFFGYQKNIQEIMNNFDILLMPSLTEGLPITILEAMSVKLPVVAADVGGIPRLLGNGKFGTLFDPLNIEELCKIIINIENNKNKFLEMADRASMEFFENYTPKVMSDSYESVYIKSM